MADGATAESQLAALISSIAGTQSLMVRFSDSLRQWNDLRSTTGALDWLAEKLVEDDIDKVRDEAESLWHRATGAYDDAIRVESQARTHAVAELRAAYKLLPDFLADSALSAGIVAKTPGLGDPGGGKYKIGPPTAPQFAFDDDFPYDPNAEATPGDYVAWNEWMAKLRGDHQIYGTSNVVINGNQATMIITVRAEAMYNFNKDAADIATGAPDNENGRFSELGWAKGFATHGELERTVTWTIGEPGTVAGGSGPDRDAPATRIARTDAAMADLRAVVTVCAVLLSLAACGTPDTSDTRDPSERATAVSTPAVRTDAEPITKRFPSLGTPVTLHWLGAAAGQDSGGVPGPTDVRIQALVELAPDVVAAAEKDYAWKPAPAGWEQTLPDALRPFGPKDADWQVNDEFTTNVSTSRYHGTVYLAPASRLVYLDVIGG